MPDPNDSDAEHKRLEALNALGILDSPRESRYDVITEFAATEFAVSISMITILDAERQWFKASVGMTTRETIRKMCFCEYTICQQSPVVVCDTSTDRRFADHPLVLADQHFRFYAGYRILGPSGFALGALEIADEYPRSFDLVETAKLVELARVVEAQIAVDYKTI